MLKGGIYVAEFGMVDKTHSQTEPKSMGSEAAAIVEVNKNAEKKLNYHGDKAAYQELKVIESSVAVTFGGGNKSAPAVPKGNLAAVALKEIEHNSPEVADLIRFLANSNRHRILANTTMTFDESAGTFRTPLGIVTSDAIDEARTLLNVIGKYTIKHDYSMLLASMPSTSIL